MDEEGEVFREVKEIRSNYCSSEDFLILEDDTGIELYIILYYIIY